jgi:hypothetical protein
MNWTVLDTGWQHLKARLKRLWGKLSGEADQAFPGGLILNRGQALIRLLPGRFRR